MKRIGNLWWGFSLGLVLVLLLSGLSLAEPAPELTLPEGAIKLSEAEPAMGEHWARPQDLPLGPIYLVWQGEVIGIEYMFHPPMMQRVAIPTPEGEEVFYAIPDLAVGAEVDHMTVDYMYPGHPGFMVGHYDVHLYFITPEERAMVGMPPAPEMAPLFAALGAQLRAPGPVYPAAAAALPADAIQLSPTVPAMGQHWARPQELEAVPPPNAGPLYLVHQGQLVGVEYMWNHDLFSGAKVTLPPGAFPEMPEGGDLWIYEINYISVGQFVDHLDLEYAPHGHPLPGYDTWHFDFHLYNITPEQKSQIPPGP